MDVTNATLFWGGTPCGQRENYMRSGKVMPPSPRFLGL